MAGYSWPGYSAGLARNRANNMSSASKFRMMWTVLVCMALSRPTIGRMMAGHLLKRRDLKAFLTALMSTSRTQLHSADPCNTFDWLMDVSEASNLKSAFYFICGGDHPNDADYEPEHPVIRNLMRRIHERGRGGLHPGYSTFQQPERIRKEADRLKHICAEEGIDQNIWGGRMHYLRWEQPVTLRAWADAGLNYDATLGYADRPGFRCGTCHEYTAFDSETESKTLQSDRSW